jgi:glucan endo-1,3-beta-D-glucosidase
MRFASFVASTASLFSTAYAQTKGYNYGSTNTDGSPRVQSQWSDAFNTAKNVAGASGFSSARLYTTIQAGTTNTPIEAIPAAISSGTTLLLGLWASAGADIMNNEIAALQAAISQYGTAFTDLVVGISVGSEDMYRISPTGVNNLSGPGTGPDVIASYIAQVRAAIASSSLSSKPVGHVDTWTAWANNSNAAAVSACDFLGVDAYPYYETENGNDISNALNLFNSALSQTQAAGQGKPIWITETGWPTTGETLAQAVPNAANAKTFWDEVGCGVLFGKMNTWWFTLEDPNFGVVGNSLSTTPLYDLTCPASSKRRSVSFNA